MMKFEIQHLFFESNIVECTEENLPSWLEHKDFKWWLDDFVLQLKIGESIESDFHKITKKE